MAGPYGAPPYKVSPGRQNKPLQPKRPNAMMGMGGMGAAGLLPDDELNDTEWPLEKTLTMPRSYTTLGR